MINKLIAKLYQVLPPKIRNSIGKSSLLKPLRDILLRSQGTFRETEVLVQRNYLNYFVNFHFFASIKTAAKAQKKGIENTILRNSINLFRDLKTAQNNAIIFDVGTNFGYLSLVWANSIAQDGLVVAFEPNTNVFSSFKKSISANNLKNIVQTSNLAVGKTNGKIQLFLGTTTSNTLEENGETKGNAVSVEMVSLDSFISKKNFLRMDIIKIDVDGIELDILEGAKELIEKFSPIFIVETNNDTRIIDFFWQRNYHVLDMALNPYITGNSLPGNIFCIPNKK